MGTDGVEIVMDCEERFGIAIEDGEAEAVRTPRMLIDLIVSKLALATEARCQSQRAFYHLRRAIVQMTGEPRRAIAPSSNIRAFLKQSTEAEFWAHLQQATASRAWPKLDLSSSLEFGRNFALVVAISLTTVALFAQLRRGYLSLESVATAWTIVTLLLLALAAIGSRPFKLRIPGRIQTLRDIVPFITSSPAINWTRPEVAAAVREIVMQTLSAPEDRYHEDADFVRDLGLE